MGFKEKWLEAVDKHNSILCAGIDPADFSMGRGDTGLPQGVDKIRWAEEYFRAVAPHIAAVKPNTQYWKNPGTHVSGIEGDLEFLARLTRWSDNAGIVSIEDAKYADIGDTNESGFFYTNQNGFNAATFAPYAGNINQITKIKQTHPDMGIITMCLMSNPEYEREKNKLVPIISTKGFDDSPDDYMNEDLIIVNGDTFVKQYIFLAKNARKFNLDGIVIGAPSEKNHIKHDEIKKVRDYVGPEMLVLLPGVGAQGGEAGIIWQYFGPNNVIVNLARGLMFPNGAYSTAEQQKETAIKYQETLNSLRKAA